MKEPSVYDYVCSLFDPKTSIDIRGFLIKQTPEEPRTKKGKSFRKYDSWKILLGAIMAYSAQYFLEPEYLQIEIAVFMYGFAVVLIWGGIQANKYTPQPKTQGNIKKHGIYIKKYLFIISLLFLSIAFSLFSSNSFNLINLTIWILGVLTLIFSFWSPAKRSSKQIFKQDWLFIVVGLITISLSLFFRLYLLNKVPGEMFSDHAEKLLDVLDIMNGKFPVFFERNTGREPIQFYLTALIVKIFNLELSFFSLKIGTVLIGILTIPFIYALGKEVSNKWGGLFAALFTGFGYWPNVISRIGLRYALYPIFVAPVLYYLIRSLKEENQNLLIVCGLFLGIGLNGYSSFRIMPILVFVVFFVFILTNKAYAEIEYYIFAFIVVIFVALSVFVPVLRYSFDHPGNFSYRMISRLTPIEHPFNDSPIIIFIKNFWDAMLMPFFRNGQIWVHSVTNRPALDAISAPLLLIGLLNAFHKMRYQKKWEYAVLLISIPILMMPSILSIAYPAENPSLNRSAGAYVPIFVCVGIGFIYLKDALMDLFPKKISKYFAAVICVGIGLLSIRYNFKLVFSDYRRQFDAYAWNTSEIGEVIENFVHTGGKIDNAFVVPFPHWVDTRLVGFNAGSPGKDFALPRGVIPALEFSGEKQIFIFKLDDLEAKNMLEELFPYGKNSTYYSATPGKDFFIYTVD
jgi:hypothetical protein